MLFWGDARALIFVYNNRFEKSLSGRVFGFNPYRYFVVRKALTALGLRSVCALALDERNPL